VNTVPRIQAYQAQNNGGDLTPKQRRRVEHKIHRVTDELVGKKGRLKKRFDKKDLKERAKRHDYAGDSDPWQNFYDSAQQVNGTAGQSVETLIATKQARLRQLLFTGRSPKNESVRDTILDRAVYSVIALSIFDRGDYSPETSGGKHATSVSLTTVRHTNMEKGIIV
jgi:hypothetical protein